MTNPEFNKKQIIEWTKILKEEMALPRNERDNDIIKRAKKSIKELNELV